jgi:hypothetical protein
VESAVKTTDSSMDAPFSPKTTLSFSSVVVTMTGLGKTIQQKFWLHESQIFLFVLPIVYNMAARNLGIFPISTEGGFCRSHRQMSSLKVKPAPLLQSGLSLPDMLPGEGGEMERGGPVVGSHSGQYKYKTRGRGT